MRNDTPRKHVLKRQVLLLSCLLLMAGCGASASPTPSPLSALPAESERVVQLAIADLAGRLKVSAAEIKVRSVEAVQWPSTALGCPQAGMMYAQVITPGYKITLTAQGKEHIYHSDMEKVVPCSGA